MWSPSRIASSRRFDGDDPAALAADVAVGGGRSNVLHLPSGASIRDWENAIMGRRREQGVGAARQGKVAFAQAQRLAGLVNGDQRRATRCVDADRRPLQPEPVVDPACLAAPDVPMAR